MVKTLSLRYRIRVVFRGNGAYVVSGVCTAIVGDLEVMATVFRLDSTHAQSAALVRLLSARLAVNVPTFNVAIQVSTTLGNLRTSLVPQCRPRIADLRMVPQSPGSASGHRFRERRGLLATTSSITRGPLTSA